jgi:hypothetical protein
MDTGPNPAANGTICSTDYVCNDGNCQHCVANAACTPTNACHAGATSCATGTSVCVDTGTNAPNYTSCGSGNVCQSGSCVACVSGGACTPADPCQRGTFDCASSTCVAQGANPALAGMACGTSGMGTCTSGQCVCPAGEGFTQGDCQACPQYIATVYVNANPSIGADGACCGATQTAGFGGPCLTITNALTHVMGSYWQVHVTGDANGNASSSETYPIALSNNVNVVGAACVPGVSGVPVFTATTDTSAVEIQGLRVGSTCAGVASGASAAVLVGATPSGRPGSALISGATLSGTRDGVDVSAGGTVNLVTGTVIHDVTNDGIHCVNGTIQTGTFLMNTLTIHHAGAHDIFAGDGCTARSIELALGVAAPCPATRPDDYGLWLEGGAFVSWFGTISCMNHDGVSLRNNGTSTSTPYVANLNGTISHCGCAGLYAEIGTASVYATTFTHDHWGVLQRTAATTGTIINLNAGTNGANTFTCNSETEPGACCTSSSCPRGFDVWNDSSLALDASGNHWDDAPPSHCTCNAMLASCACTGAAAGMTTPPSDTSVVDSPHVSGAAGVTNTANATAVSPASGCF